MDMSTITSFLRDLQANNNREWFHANKKRFEEEVKQPFEALIGNLIMGLQQVDPDIQIHPKDAIFRINRDTRFSSDKSPYKTNVGALLSKFGRKNKSWPGFYIHLEPGNFMIGGGAYFIDKKGIENVRNAIYQSPTDWQALISSPDFRQYFDGIRGERYKRLPKPFNALIDTYPEIANKQFYFGAEYPAEKFDSPNVVNFVLDHFNAAQPINQYLSKALFDQ